MKICTKCNQEKLALHFTKNRSDCKACRKEYQKQYYLKNINVEKEKRKIYYKKNSESIKNYQKLRRVENPNIDVVKNLAQYGLTLEQYTEIALNQNNKCAICNHLETAIIKKNNKIKKLSVDHDHVTNKIRGLLCVNCNRGIGSFKDNIDNLKRAIIYLERTSV